MTAKARSRLPRSRAGGLGNRRHKCRRAAVPTSLGAAQDIATSPRGHPVDRGPAGESQ